MPKRADMSDSEDVALPRAKRGRLSGPSSLGSSLNRLRIAGGSASLCDVVLIVEGTRYPAHRAVLAASSPVFNKMFTNGMRESNMNEIELKEVSGRTWDAALHFVYTSAVDLEGPNFAMNLLETARRFEINGLESAAARFLMNELAHGHTLCCHILAFADRFDLPDLKRRALDTLAGNFHTVWRWHSFFELDESLVTEVLSEPDLRVIGERTTFDAALHWLTGRVRRSERGSIREGISDAESSESDNEHTDLCQKDREIVAERGNRGCAVRILAHVKVENLRFHELSSVLNCVKDMTRTSEFAARVQARMLSRRIPEVEVSSAHYLPQKRGTQTLTLTYRHYGIDMTTGSGTDDWEVHSAWVGDGNGLFWRLEVYPRGDDNERHRFVGLYLRARDATKKKADWKISAQLFLVKPGAAGAPAKAVNVSLMEERAVHEIEEFSIGDSAFIAVNRLLDPARAFVDDEAKSVTFGATVYIVGNGENERITRKRKLRPL